MVASGLGGARCSPSSPCTPAAEFAIKTETQYGGSKQGKSGLYSIEPVPSLLLPTDRIDPAYIELPSLGSEVASDVSSEVSLVRDSTEHASSGDPVKNLTKV